MNKKKEVVIGLDPDVAEWLAKFDPDYKGLNEILRFIMQYSKDNGL